MGQHDNRLVVAGEHPPEPGLDAEHLEIILRYGQSKAHLRGFADGHRNQALGDHRFRIAEVQEVEIRNEPKRLPLGGCEHALNFIRAFDGQRTKQDGIDDAPESRRQADSNGE
jgi:hypothetical protein